MSELKLAFEELGFTKVQTVLATGNVLFNSKSRSISVLNSTIEKRLEQQFGFPIVSLIRTLNYLVALAKMSPFSGIKITPQTRLYVTFFRDELKRKASTPIQKPDNQFRILKVTDGALFSTLVLSPTNSTVDVMTFLTKEFGKNISTRNWNTIARILEADESD